MGSKISTIVEDVRQFGRHFESVIKMADALEKIGRLELAESELEGAVIKLKAERDKLVKDIDSVKSKAEAESKKTIDDANTYALNAAQKANNEAESIIKKAQEEARLTSADAKADAKAVKAECDKLSKKLESLKKETVDKEAVLDGINGKIEKARGQVKKLLGD